MSDQNGVAAATGGIGFFGALFIALLVLKLTGYIAWSWWWVSAPLWGPAAVVLAMLIVALVIVIIATVVKHFWVKRRAAQLRKELSNGQR